MKHTNTFKDNNLFIISVAFSIIPILSICYLCCRYAEPEELLLLYFTEWIFIILFWKLLCPWLKYKIVFFASIPFVLSFLISVVIINESISVFDAPWNWSDDWYYLNEAGRVIDTLHSTGWSLREAWLELANRRFGAWTLSGWPFFLGLVSSCYTRTPPELIHAIAVSLNATFLSVVLALIYNFLNDISYKNTNTVLLSYLLVIGDPIVYSSLSLKESMLQFSLMLIFVSIVKLSYKINLFWLSMFVFGFLGLATTRPAYILLLLVIMYIFSVKKNDYLSLPKIMLGLVIILFSWELIFNLHIREATIGELITVRTLQAEPGLAMTIYNIPVVGRFIFYAISPVPPLPWKLHDSELIYTTFIRGIGSLTWLFAFIYVIYGFVKKQLPLKDKRFLATVFIFLGLFTAVIIYSSDPRYKQPTNFYLSILFCFTWYYRNQKYKLIN